MTPNTYGEDPIVVTLKKLFAEMLVELKRQGKTLDKLVEQTKPRKPGRDEE